MLHSGTSSSAGVAESVVGDVHVVPYNNTEAVRALVSDFGGDIAAIIAEPIAPATWD